ncbi:hypothetical protein KI387_013048, partial [Taxus chinensis]
RDELFFQQGTRGDVEQKFPRIGGISVRISHTRYACPYWKRVPGNVSSAVQGDPRVDPDRLNVIGLGPNGVSFILQSSKGVAKDTRHPCCVAFDSGVLSSVLWVRESPQNTYLAHPAEHHVSMSHDFNFITMSSTSHSMSDEEGEQEPMGVKYETPSTNVMGVEGNTTLKDKCRSYFGGIYSFNPLLDMQ